MHLTNIYNLITQHGSRTVPVGGALSRVLAFVARNTQKQMDLEGDGEGQGGPYE